MNHSVISPCEELKDFVSHFWATKWDPCVVDSGSTYYLTANSLTEIAFGFVGSELLFASVQGQTNKNAQFASGGFYELFGVALYSHAIPFLFHMPASELNNCFFAPDTLLGKEGYELTEKIATATSTQQRVHILSDYFKLQLRKNKSGDTLLIQAAQLIRQHHGNVNIVQLSDEFCLSQKQFERRFKASSGFTPKLFSRIVRFESILNTYSRYSNLTEAAHQHGYYDQAHFIHDFKTFSGYSPNKFFELSGY